MKRCPFSFPFSVIWLKGAMHIFSYHTKGSAVLYIEEQASHWMRYVYHLLPQCLRKHWVCFFLIETAEKIGWVYHVRFIHCVSGRGVCFHAVHQNPLQTISWIMQRLRWKYSLRHPPPPPQDESLRNLHFSQLFLCGSQVIVQIWVLRCAWLYVY